MEIFWLVWQERNNRIFLNKYQSSLILLGSINSFISFWLTNITEKKWRTFARHSGHKGVAGNRAVLVRWSVSSAEPPKQDAVQGEQKE